MKKILFLPLSLLIIFNSTILGLAASKNSSSLEKSKIIEKYVNPIQSEKELEVRSFSSEEDSWENAEVIDQGIEEVVILDEDQNICATYKDNEALNYLINMEEEQIRSFKGITDDDLEKTGKSNIFYVQTYKKRKKNASIEKKNITIDHIKNIAFNMSSVYWSKMGTVIYSILSGLPRDEFEDCSEITFKDQQIRVFRKRTYYYKSKRVLFPQLIVEKNKTSHRIIFDAVFVNDDDHDTIHESKDYGILEVYEHKNWDEIYDSAKYAHLLYMGNPKDSPMIWSENMRKNLAKKTFKDYMKDVEKIREYKKWIKK